MDILHLCRFPPEADPPLADERSPKDGVKKVAQDYMGLQDD